MSNLSEYVAELKTNELIYSKSWVSNVISALGKSFKIACYKSKLKYTKENIIRYLNYVSGMNDLLQTIPIHKLKFLDESHFVSRSLYRRKGVAPKGKRLIVVNNTKPLDYSFSLTMMTTLDHDIPIIGSLREKSNNQFDFIHFICESIQGGFLKKGDYLVMDNASVHSGQEIFDVLLKIAQKAEFTVLFLPCYSPELNPCEQIFSAIKTHLRTNRPLDGDHAFWVSIVKAMSTITHQMVLNFYYHCLYNYQEDLEACIHKEDGQ